MKKLIRPLLIVAVLGVVVAYPTKDLQDHSNSSDSASWDAAATPRLTMVTKAQWGGRAATSTTLLRTPVPNVIIHHMVTNSCLNRNACSEIMRNMQHDHMNNRGWPDIGYNFAVGGNGEVYVGTGWIHMGSHVAGWNVNSIGIAFIGTFSSSMPTMSQDSAARALIMNGVNNGMIARNYRLMGHRQAAANECPGDALFRLIQGYPNWSNAEVDFDEQLE